MKGRPSQPPTSIITFRISKALHMKIKRLRDSGILEKGQLTAFIEPEIERFIYYVENYGKTRENNPEL